MPGRGVIYLVSGPRSYMSELSTSLASLRRHEPDLPVTVFSRYAVPRRAKCDHVEYDDQQHPLKQKVLVLKESPYEQTLFLDTDTTILAPIQDVFRYLDECNFAVAKGSLMDRTHVPPKMIDLVSPDEYNTGVLLYDASTATRRFLGEWEGAVMPQDPTDMWAGHHCDQTYFNRIVPAGAPEQCGMAFGVFPNVVYNVRGYMVDEMKRRGLWSEARILHHRTRQMKFRKALFALGDAAAARELVRKGSQKVRSRLAH